MIIRAAVDEDIPALVEMGARFFSATPYSKIINYDPASIEKTLKHLIDSDDGILLVAGNPIVGVAGALLYPFYFNLSHKTGNEIFWWVDEDQRGVGLRLFKSLENSVKEAGADSFSMSEITGMKPAGHIYERAGYVQSDSTFIKRF